MRERVDELGGSLTIESGNGSGTVISASLPLSAA
jgi:signal transduction histidine kinase